MAGDKVQLKLRLSGIKTVRVKKRKAGVAINAAVVKEVVAKHHKTVVVVHWSVPGRHGLGTMGLSYKSPVLTSALGTVLK